MRIILPIFFKNDEYETNEVIGKETPYEDFDKRYFIFYHINCISPFHSDIDNKTYTCIHSNGSEFICPHSPKETEELIDKYL